MLEYKLMIEASHQLLEQEKSKHIKDPAQHEIQAYLM